MASLLISACHTPVVCRCGCGEKIVYNDHTVAAVIPTEIRVSIDAMPRRALRRATRWNGQAAHVTMGNASAVRTQGQPVNRVEGSTANITDRCDSGTNKTAATARRTSSDRATASSGSGRSSVPVARSSA